MSVRLVVARGTRRARDSLVTQATSKRPVIGRIGAAPQVDAESMRVRNDRALPAPAARLECRWSDLGDVGVQPEDARKMVVGPGSWKNLSGPVTIADYAGQSAQLGIGAYIAFSR